MKGPSSQQPAAAGALEAAPVHTPLVPGTEVMVDVGAQHLVKSTRSHTVLVPQPSDDPHDPLNWQPRWKTAAIAAATLVTFSQTIGPLAIAPIFPELAKEFDAGLADVVQFTGVTILLLGFANFLWVPLSETFGRRFVLLASTALNLISTIWRARATSYNSFLGAAILAGIAAAPGEALQPTVVADIIFLHERGFYTTMYFVCFYSGVILGPIIQGAMAQAVGWRTFWWLNVAVNAFSLLMTLVAFPETRWPRGKATGGSVVPCDLPSHDSHGDSHSKDAAGRTSDGDLQATDRISEKILAGGKPKRSQFRLWQPHADPLRSLGRAFWQPWKIMCFPIVQFASFIVGFSSTCYLILTLIQAEAFEAPPYRFGSLATGLTNFAALGGALIGLATAGPLSDIVTRKLTIRNGGIREPEMRLVAMVPYVGIMLLGNFVVAFGLQNHWDWRAVVIVGFGCAGLQIAALPAIAATYAVDSYKPAAGAIFISVTINKNLWGYGYSRFITPWIERSGYVPPLMLNMCLLFLWCSCGVIFWFFGKRFRTWTASSSVHLD